MTISGIDAHGRLAAFHRTREQEAAAEQALAAEAAQEAAAEAAERERAERVAALQARKQARLELAELADEPDPHQPAYDLAVQARQAEEEEFTARVEKEYSDALIAHRTQATMAGAGLSLAQRTNAIQQAEKEKQAKIQAFLLEREMRELEAESYDDPLHRTAYSLSDRGREIMHGLLDGQPTPVERARAKKQKTQQEAQQSKTAELQQAYIAELQSRMSGGFVPRHLANEIKNKYRAMGLIVDSTEVVQAVMSQLRR